MSLVAAAICPHPPVLVPEVASGAAAELDDLRAACRAAIGALAGSGAHRLAVIGSGPATRPYQPPFAGSFAPWGLPLLVCLEPGAVDPDPADAGHDADSAPTEQLPLSLLMGAWLLATSRPGQVRVTMTAIAAGTPAPECARLGAELVSAELVSAEPVALLVMGDGSACRGEKAPGYHDPRAEPFDAQVANAFATVDPAALLALDVDLARQLGCAGRVAWQALAGAVLAGTGPGRVGPAARVDPAARVSPAAWHGEVLYDGAPYGVAYLVATWTRAPGAGGAP